MVGAAFAKQNENRQWKYYSWEDGQPRMNGLGLMREIDEKQGAYAGTMQHADTWKTMSQEVERAHFALADPTVIPNTQQQQKLYKEQQELPARLKQAAYLYRMMTLLAACVLQEDLQWEPEHPDV